jgi:hypothetical protein
MKYFFHLSSKTSDKYQSWYLACSIEIVEGLSPEALGALCTAVVFLTDVMVSHTGVHPQNSYLRKMIMSPNNKRTSKSSSNACVYRTIL